MRAAFLQIKNIWASPSLTININIRIISTTAKHVLLYGAETWRTTAAMLKKIQTFINTCLRRTLRIHQQQRTIETDQATENCGDGPSNTELWRRTKQQGTVEMDQAKASRS